RALEHLLEVEGEGAGYVALLFLFLSSFKIEVSSAPRLHCKIMSVSQSFQLPSYLLLCTFSFFLVILCICVFTSILILANENHSNVLFLVFFFLSAEYNGLNTICCVHIRVWCWIARLPSGT
uniref:Uncharacterized protein n=1 Tax=Junco hyemalis TaxID=40217 RepID=A0A8C5IKZ0_JUNHY